MLLVLVLMQMAKETIYLCNFRVSVDGDWLCLQELTDVQLDTSIYCPSEDGGDPMTVERCNLLDVFKLIIKELLDSSLSHGRMLDDTHTPLQQFFLIIEHIFRHGIKPKKGILRDKRDFWEVLEQVEKFTHEAKDITTSVREMPHVKSPLGRARAWIRLALMQKRLPDYFRLLVEKRDDILCDFYEPGAMMLEEESMIISGLLVGLNVIDCNIGIKDEDLDQPMGLIDFSLYLRETVDMEIQSSSNPMEMSHRSQQMAAILDQKNYLEELNRHLNATVTNLQQKLEGLQTANTLMKEDMAIAKNNILQLQQENSIVRSEKEALLDEHRKQMQTAQDDIDTERAAYHMSRQGLDTMYKDIQQRLRMEATGKQELEKDLEQEINAKRELEITLRLLEKDSKAKQSQVNSAKKELEGLRNSNQELINKLQMTENASQDRNQYVKQLEERVKWLEEHSGSSGSDEMKNKN